MASTVVPPDGFKTWFYINATIYAVPMNAANQSIIMNALAERFEKGLISDLTVTLASTNNATYNVKFREKANTKTLTLTEPNYLVLQPDGLLNVIDEPTLRSEYTDKLEGGVYLDQGAVLRI